MPWMGSMCGRGLCFQTSTLLLCFSPSPTTHLVNSQGAPFPRSLTKAAKAPTNSKEEGAGRNGKVICPKTLPNGKWRCQGPEMGPRLSRTQFASSLVMQLLLATALLCHLGLVVHSPPAPLPSSRGPSL